MIKIYFDGTYIDSDNYANITNDFKQFDSEFMLGTTSANSFKLEVPKACFNTIPSEVTIEIDEEDYAHLIVDKCEYKDNDLAVLELTDKMTLFNFNYDASAIVPCTVKDILKNICDVAGVELGTTGDFVNSNVPVNFYNNTIQARQYLGYIAELMGGFARIGKDGKLYLENYTDTNITVDIDECEDFKIGSHHTIERVVFDSGLFKYTSSDDESLETLYLNSDNVYINSEAIFDNIANVILGLDFYSFQTGNCPINPDIMAGDIFSFTDGTNTYKTIAQYSLDYNGQWLGGYELDVNSKKQQETKQLGPAEMIKHLSVQLDREKNELTILAKQISDDYMTASQVEEFVVNSQEGVTNTLIKAGGNNLMKNSALLFADKNQNSDTNLFDYIHNYKANQSGIRNKIGLNDVLISAGTPTTANVHITGDLDITDRLEDNEQYTISQFVASARVYIEVRLTRASDEQQELINCKSSSLRTNSFTVDKTTYSKYEIYVTSDNNTTDPIDTTNIYWLEKGEGTLTSYEAYEVISGYEYWTGRLLKGNADEYGVVSETGTVILTQIGGASQSVSTVPDVYTLSCKYKRISPLSTLTFEINGEPIKEYSYVLTEDTTFTSGKTYYEYINNEYIEYTGETSGNPHELGLYELIVSNVITQEEGTIEEHIACSSGVINIAFSSNIQSGYAIYDLMLNKGDTALDYSQNANETTTDTVKIGKGIAVTSDTTDTTTRIDSDGFRVLNKNDEHDVLLRATDTGTDTKTLEVREWAEISGLRIQQVNGQIWMTGIT